MKSSYLLSLFAILTIFKQIQGCDFFRLEANDHESYPFLTYRPFQDQLVDVIGGGSSVKVTKMKMMEMATSRALDDYQSLGQSDERHLHTVVIALKQRNVDKLEELLHDVSNPDSPNYGQYLKHHEIMKMTSPDRSIDHVRRYLLQNGVTILSTTPYGDFITAEAPIRVWNQLFDCTFHDYEAKVNSFGRLRRTSQYHLDETIASHILTIFNTVHFPDPSRLTKKTFRKPVDITTVSTGNNRGDNDRDASLGTTAVTITGNEELASLLIDGYVTPKLLYDFYGINPALGNALTTQAVYESIGQSFSPKDLSIFQHHFNLSVESVAVDIGGHNEDENCLVQGGNNCVEANLDVQYIMAVAPHVPTTYYYWGGHDFMLDWLVQVASMASPPKVISISYGMDEDYLTEAYAQAFNIQAMRLGLNGVTLTASSGDDGAASSRARNSALYCGYHPSFPASSPYVLAVGGTMGPEKGQSEIVCQSDRGGIITSGGGFSSVYSSPSWQTNATQGYLAKIHGTNRNPKNGYNTGGRGYPDVSALALNYVIALAHNLTAVSGTSASSPVVAGMISLVNSARVAAGKSTLGWVNPAIYRYAHLFTRDITSGDNRCVADATICCEHGYYATEGWDAVTGFGSIDFPRFKEVMTGLGNALNSPTAGPTLAPSGPTMRPTTLTPTVSPSSAPTMSRGWLSILSYDEEYCIGRVASISAVPTDVCLALYDSDRKTTGSMKYSCLEDDVASATYYSDSTCSSDSVTQQTKIFMGCAYHVSGYYDQSASTSSEITCSSDATSLPPLPSYDGSYIVHSSYDSLTGCEEGRQSAVDATLQNHCFDLSGQDMSYQFAYPKLNVYSSTGCKSQNFQSQINLNTQCEETQRQASGYGYNRRLDRALNDTGYGVNAQYYSDEEPVNIATTEDDVNGTDYEAYAYYSYEGTAQYSYAAVAEHERELQEGTSYAYGDQDTADMYNVWSLADIAPPSAQPSLTPISLPSAHPSLTPSLKPSSLPSVGSVPSNPSYAPTILPSVYPSVKPSFKPSSLPSSLPSAHPTANPSSRPSVLPTPSPTTQYTLSPIQVNRNANFSVICNQVLNGMDVATWNLNADKHFEIVRSAIFQSLDELVEEQRIIFLGISNGVAQSIESQSVATCTLSYSIVLTLSQTDFSSVNEVVSVVQTRLRAAVEDGSFDRLLTHGAAANQVPELLHISTASVAVVDVQTDSSSGSSKLTKEDESGIIGGVIGCAVILLFTAFILWYTGRCKSWREKLPGTESSSLYGKVSLESDSVHHSVMNPISNEEGADSRKKGRMVSLPDEDVEIELSAIIANRNRSTRASFPSLNEDTTPENEGV